MTYLSKKGAAMFYFKILSKKLCSFLFLFTFFVGIRSENSLEHPFLIDTIEISQTELAKRKPIKSDWTFIVYLAADNDLDYFAYHNIKAMSKVGSNENISIVVQLDRYGAHQYTKRLYVTKEVVYQVNVDDSSSQQKLNFGSPQTLIDCCQWAITQYPAHHYALVLWNHGTGILDSIPTKTTNASELFTFNPANHMLELDRSINFLDFLEHKNTDLISRGVCFSDTYGSYLTNQKLDYALKTVCEKILHKKFDIIAFDACLMAMVEVAHLISPYTDYMAASEEVELGTGYPYNLILAPFATQTLTPYEFAQQIVIGYAQGYEHVTKDFTQSAIDLSRIEALEKNITKVSSTLIEMIHHELDFSVKRSIKASRAKRACTCFAEPTYIDLHHFYSNLFEAIDFMHLTDSHAYLKNHVKDLLQEGIKLITKAVIANQTGANLQKAKGLAIYFPLRSIDGSYLQTTFAKNTSWVNLLKLVL